MAKRENDLGRDPIGKLLLRLAVPTVTAQLVNALYNIVDRIYIGHIPGEGDLALTGLGICFPVILFVSAISALVGMGGGSRAVVRMGEGKLDEANKILGNCTLLLMILGLAATVVFQLCKEPMLYLFGATENTISYSMDYLNIYLYGSIFVELALGLNFFITSQGFSTVGMASVIIGAVVNIVLDPILIFGLNMGVKGAALATITAQAVSAVGGALFVRQAHQAADSAAASPSGRQGAGPGAGPGALTLHYAVHRESGQHRLQFLPQDLRRRPGGGRHDHLLQYHAGLFPSVSGPVPGGPAHCGL
jgi:Na+-driven multidrug efflux pump